MSLIESLDSVESDDADDNLQCFLLPTKTVINYFFQILDAGHTSGKTWSGNFLICGPNFLKRLNWSLLKLSESLLSLLLTCLAKNPSVCYQSIWHQEPN